MCGLLHCVALKQVHAKNPANVPAENLFSIDLHAAQLSVIMNLSNS